MIKKCKVCGSFAINHHLHGRDGSDDELCDVCFWVKRAKSHDELVQINQELLAALDDAATSLETIQLRSFGEDSFLDSKPEMRSYAGSRASVARGAIAKAKGGAA